VVIFGLAALAVITETLWALVLFVDALALVVAADRSSEKTRVVGAPERAHNPGVTRGIRGCGLSLRKLIVRDTSPDPGRLIVGRTSRRVGSRRLHENRSSRVSS
jgi:hypothetical protein